MESLRQQLSNYDKDKMTLQLTKQRLLHADKQLKNLEWEKEVLSQRFTKIEAERNELFAKFESSVQEVQQKTGLKKMLLEKKVEALNQALEKKQTQLAEVVVAANMESGTLQNVRTHSDCITCSQNLDMYRPQTRQEGTTWLAVCVYTQVEMEIVSVTSQMCLSV